MLRNIYILFSFLGFKFKIFKLSVELHWREMTFTLIINFLNSIMYVSDHTVYHFIVIKVLGKLKLFWLFSSLFVLWFFQEFQAKSIQI